MSYINFIRFIDAPIIPLFEGGSGTLIESNVDFYKPLLRPDDVVKFIFDVDANTTFPIDEIKIALIEGDVVAYDDLGTVLNGKYWSVTMPADLAEGCYRFLIYSQTFNGTTWAETGVECEVVGGENTGYQLITEERTVDEDPTNTALFISNLFQYSAWKIGKLIEFRGRQNGWGFDYETLESFYQTFRLDIEISRTKYPDIKKVYRQSNGIYRHANVMVDKKVMLETDYFDEDAHNAMANAIKHDLLYINNIPYFSADEYEPEWVETGNTDNRYYEMAKATTELYVQGYDQRNNVCGGSDNVEIVPPECLEVNDGLPILVD